MSPDPSQSSREQSQRSRLSESRFGRLLPQSSDPIIEARNSYLEALKSASPVTSKGTRLGEGIVNLAFGVYQDERGKVAYRRETLAASAQILADMVSGQLSPDYLPMAGLPAFLDVIKERVFSPATSTSVAAIQTAGGTDAISKAAMFLRLMRDFDGSVGTNVALTDPTWANHPGVFGREGFSPIYLPYYSDVSKRFDLAPYLDHMGALPRKSAVVLHVCCHNPTGSDPSEREWENIARFFSSVRRDLIPVFDFAYQGFADTPERDAYPVQLFAESGLNPIVGYSCSKTDHAYNARVGALLVQCSSTSEAAIVKSNLESKIARLTSSSPSLYGAAMVTAVHSNPILRKLWREDLKNSHARLHSMRHSLVKLLNEHGIDRFDFAKGHRGMFSLLGLNKDEERALRSKGVYIPLGNSGRICFAALNDGNIEYTAAALAAVAKGE